MLPQSSTASYKTGLVDIEVGTSLSSRDEIEKLCLEQLHSLVHSTATSSSRCAPWCKPAPIGHNLIDAMSTAKIELYAMRTTPLVHYRTEELSQMLLDSFHPTRSQRYHSRRYKFIRKVKSDVTPARYAGALAYGLDEEDSPEFDLAEGWIRGQEWEWVGMDVPSSLATSEWTRVPLFDMDNSTDKAVAPELTRSPSDSSAGSPQVLTPESVHQAQFAPAEVAAPAKLSTVDKIKQFGRQVTSSLRSPTKVTRNGQDVKVGEKDSAPAYSKPSVPGDDKVEFPCLYDSETVAAPTTESTSTKPDRPTAIYWDKSGGQADPEESTTTTRTRPTNYIATKGLEASSNGLSTSGSPPPTDTRPSVPFPTFPHPPYRDPVVHNEGEGEIIVEDTSKTTLPPVSETEDHNTTEDVTTIPITSGTAWDAPTKVASEGESTTATEDITTIPIATEAAAPTKVAGEGESTTTTEDITTIPIATEAAAPSKSLPAPLHESESEPTTTEDITTIPIATEASALAKTAPSPASAPTQAVVEDVEPKQVPWPDYYPPAPGPPPTGPLPPVPSTTGH